MSKQPTEYLKYEYTDEEIADAARELATANKKRTSLEQRKKEVDAAIKAEIEVENSAIGRLSNLISTGFEYRDIEVTWTLDTPEDGMKRCVRNDTGEEVKVVRMTDSDRQFALDLKTAAEAAEAAEQERVEREKAELQEAYGSGAIVTPPPLLARIEAPTPEVAPDEITNGVTVLPMDSPGEEQGHGKRGKRK